MKSGLLCKYSILLLLLVATCCFTSCRSVKKVNKNEEIISEYIKHSDNIKASPLQHEIADAAISWIGTPYAYARSDKGAGTDCSGLVLKVYEEIAGIKLPRNSAKQAEYCQELSPGEVQIGDLVFFATGSDPDKISHVGIMIDNVNFVHSSTKKGVVISRIDTPYYIRTFRMFGRIR